MEASGNKSERYERDHAALIRVVDRLIRSLPSEAADGRTDAFCALDQLRPFSTARLIDTLWRTKTDRLRNMIFKVLGAFGVEREDGVLLTLFWKGVLNNPREAPHALDAALATMSGPRRKLYQEILAKEPIKGGSQRSRRSTTNLSDARGIT